MSLAPVVVRLLSIRQARRPVNRAFYGLLASYFGPDTPWHFMNYGFDSECFREHPLPLRPEHTIDRLGIQLYDHLLSSVPIAGKIVLEVGCGRGGGAAYMANYLRPRRLVGVDLCHKSVRICGANHDRNIAFLTADAHQLPFRDGSFDVVVNVESSHGYASVAAFLREARRVLIPGGFLVFADLRWDRPVNRMRPARGLTQLKEQLCNSGLCVVHEADISAGVLRARAADQQARRAAIEHYVPRGLQGAFMELAGLPGTAMYRCLEERRLIYWSSILRKAPNAI